MTHNISTSIENLVLDKFVLAGLVKTNLVFTGTNEFSMQKTSICLELNSPCVVYYFHFVTTLSLPTWYMVSPLVAMVMMSLIPR